jgi:hypothetical protein
MAKKTLLTHNAKVNASLLNYYAPSAVIPPNYGVNLATSYFVIAKVNPWPDNDNLPEISQSNLEERLFFKNAIAAKHITTADISPVAERINWTANTVYAFYDDKEDMLAKDDNGFLLNKFYVKNRYDQVFKCVWNNNETQSIYEPFLEPGSFGSNLVFNGSDGYKWKYLYTIDTFSKVKFMDDSWMPVPVDPNLVNPLVSKAGVGNIDVINVVEHGYLYDLSNAAISVRIVGDGTAANGVPGTTAAGYATVAPNGEITDIIVTDAGKDYNWANVIISSAIGFGAHAIAPVSPIGGHGFDNVSELGCSHVMYNVEFDGSESGLVPTDIDYHQVGIVINPVSKSLNPLPANNTVYKASTELLIAAGYGTYISGETVFQGGSLETATFVATALSHNTASNVLRVINKTGSYSVNSPLYAADSKTTRTLLTVTEPDIVLPSGYLTYIENRSTITRSPDGIEQFKIVIGY